MITIDGPTKLVRQDAIFGGLSIGDGDSDLHRHIVEVNTVPSPGAPSRERTVGTLWDF